MVSLVRWPASALKGRPSIARGVSPGYARRSGFILSPAGATVAPRGYCRPFRAEEKKGAVALPGLTPRAIDERPFRAEDKPWLSSRSKRDDRTRWQASVVRNSSVKRSR